MSAPVVTTHWSRIADWHDSSAFDVLDANYRDPARGYHDWSHIIDMLTKLDRLTHLATRPDLIAAAIFWHDSVFITRAPDGSARPDPENVHDSAALFAAHSRFPEKESAAIRDMILATAQHLSARPEKEHYAGFARDLDLFLDLDLSALGADWPVFQSNYARIRAEYPWIDEADFDRQRQGMLGKFAASCDSLFRLDEPRRLWAASARENCQRIHEEIAQRLGASS